MHLSPLHHSTYFLFILIYRSWGRTKWGIPLLSPIELINILGNLPRRKDDALTLKWPTHIGTNMHTLTHTNAHTHTHAQIHTHTHTHTHISTEIEYSTLPLKENKLKIEVADNITSCI